jgi:branched-chain amino acid transport system ATP-binding protein
VLALRDAEVRYGDFTALRDVSLSVGAGEFVAIVGANAAGKSTLLRGIAGLLRLSRGMLEFAGEDLSSVSTDVRMVKGIVLVPEGRHIFPYLTVEENLKLGSWPRHLRPGAAGRLESTYALIPRLRERAAQFGGSLSGGEQQMLAIGRALMSQPRLLMLDEPSLGLSPMWVDAVYAIIEQIAGSGTAILLVEQNVPLALTLASRAYVLANGRCVKEDTAAALAQDDDVRAAYMGV